MKDTPAQQSVSTGPAAALVISNMIGIGIFTSLGFQIGAFTNRDGGSQLAHGGVFPIMLLWLVGGLLALCGALCYAELATALPRSGGEYNFLSRIYHPAVGFCTGLTSVTIGFAAPIAMSALTFGDYFCRTFPRVGALDAHMNAILASVLVSLGTLAHLRSVRFSGGVQAMTTAVTVLLILAFVVCGFGRAAAQPVSFAPQPGDLSLIGSSAFGSSLIWVMYSYSGWNAASYIAGEVRNPGNVALGSVDDIVMGPEGGKIAYLVVARGGIFGLGERHVAVPWDQFKVSPNLNILVLDTSKDGMDQAPRMIEGRFTTAEPFARQTAKADAYWSAAAKTRRTD